MATAQPLTRISGPTLPQAMPWPPKPQQIHEIRIEHPPIEADSHFLGRISPSDLVPAARCYNPSLCRHGGSLLMAYRAESYTAISRIAMAELDSELTVRRTLVVPLPEAPGDCHWEDPRLVDIGGRLHLMACYVRLIGGPPVCQQRLFVLDSKTFEPTYEYVLGFGRIAGIEKNWAPFEGAEGKACFVYQQRPRMVIEVESRAGHESPGVPIAPAGASLSGRSCPIRAGNELLEFVGGWVRIQQRGGRYWYGAQMVRAHPPYDVTRYIPQPLAWGSEASPTIHSPRPGGGHPCHVFPSGAALDGDGVIVSVGVNDSYCVLMRYGLQELWDMMIPS